MPKIKVRIPKVGIVYFPDAMTEDQIREEAARLHAQSIEETAQKAPMEALKRLPSDIYNSMKIPDAPFAVGNPEALSPEAAQMHMADPGWQERSNSILGGYAGMVGSLDMKPWYSSLRNVAENKLSSIIEGTQAKETLRKRVTADEWSGVGLDKKLQPGQKYTKQEILNEIDEKTYNLKDAILEDADTQFSDFQEFGGTNYKELFVTAPGKNKLYQDDAYQLWEQLNLKYGTADERMPEKLWPESDPEVQRFRKLDQKYQDTVDEKSWFDGHESYADIENPIVRLRFNDRIDAEGKKVLFLEEMQPPDKEFQAKMPAELMKRWREIGMKRAVTYAIEHGYDRVAWTTGEMQKLRYPTSSEGLMRVYDQDLPNVAKKLGAKVEKTSVYFDYGTPESGDKLMYRTVPSISVSPLRETASKGFPVFGIPAGVGAATAADLLYDEEEK